MRFDGFVTPTQLNVLPGKESVRNFCLGWAAGDMSGRAKFTDYLKTDNGFVRRYGARDYGPQTRDSWPQFEGATFTSNTAV